MTNRTENGFGSIVDTTYSTYDGAFHEVYQRGSAYYGYDWASGAFGEGYAAEVSPGDQYYTQLALFKYETGALLNWGVLNGYAYRVISGDAVGGYVFPVTVGAWYRDDGTPNPVASWYQGDEGAHTHVVGGYNRILGYSDLNANGSWDMGEPVGLSLYNSVYVGPDSFKATIPLTDELFGFPRISWPASTNSSVTRYVVNIANSGGKSVVGSGLVVEAPRTFVHEGDFIEAGINGIDFVGKSQETFTWKVLAKDASGTAEIQMASGTFSASFLSNSGSRRAMKAVSPVSGSTVFDKVVEFQWNMDWRTEGVFFTVKNAAGTAVKGLDNLYVPFPVRHGKITDDDYYYTAVPQLENGRSLVALEPGTYTYTIKENLRTTAISPKTVTGTFTIGEDEDSRLRAAINGHVHYYGRLPNEYVPGKVVVQAYEVSNRARTSLSIGGNPVARTTVEEDGSFSLRGLKAGTYAVIAWVDGDGDGKFGDADTQGYGFLGNSATPHLAPDLCQPLVITNTAECAAVDLNGVNVVLRDRDVDGDGVPDGAGFPASASLEVRTFPGSANPESTGSDWGRPGYKLDKYVVVKAPRNFLHEGDFECARVLGLPITGASECSISTRGLKGIASGCRSSIPTRVPPSSARTSNSRGRWTGATPAWISRSNVSATSCTRRTFPARSSSTKMAFRSSSRMLRTTVRSGRPCSTTPCRSRFVTDLSATRIIASSRPFRNSKTASNTSTSSRVTTATRSPNVR